MAFKRPQYMQGFYVVETTFGTEIVPADLFRNSGAELAPHVVAPYCEGEPTEPAQRAPAHQWVARLSAPGYMDATDWNGPFNSLDEAKRHIEDVFDIDSETGDDPTETYPECEHETASRNIVNGVCEHCARDYQDAQECGDLDVIDGMTCPDTDCAKMAAESGDCEH